MKEALCRPFNANIKALTVVHSFINKVILGSLLSQKSSPRSGQKNNDNGQSGWLGKKVRTDIYITLHTHCLQTFILWGLPEPNVVSIYIII